MDPHVFLYIQGVKVAFPFQPYETQRKYMEKVVEAISGKHNAILESPTGTGKTLSLLCASLAWQQSQSTGSNTIYYTSRTHLQLSQAAKEMKRTAYAAVPAVVIGSRAQMCLNDEVNKQPPHLINRSCRNAIAKNGCNFYMNYEQKLESLSQNIVHDIEDLHQFGRSHQCCPYYASKKLADSKSSIVFMPYNYLLDTSIGKSTQLKLENSVVIFDEAHNIEGSLSDAASGFFRDSCLTSIQESCRKLPEKISDALNREKGLTRFGYEPKQKSTIVDELATTKNKKQKEDKEPKVNLIEELAEKLTTDKIRQINVCVELLKNSAKKHMKLDETCDIDRVYTVLEQSSISYTTSNAILTTLESMISFWSVAGVMNVNQVSKYVTALGNLNHVIALLFPEECLSIKRQIDHKDKLIKSYKAHLKGIYPNDGPLEDAPLVDWELNVWCLNPAIGLDRVIDSRCINGPRSLIITSGTLTPRNEVITSLNRKFRISEGFDHVIGENQLKVLLVGESPKKFILKADYLTTQKSQFYKELAQTLLPTLKLLPYGTLVFFSSYKLMNNTIKEFRDTHLWTQLKQVSSIFIESQSKEAFETDLSTYKRKIDSSNERAIFFGVCRGKLSEGVNLDGNQCRTVVVVGLPFPNKSDAKVSATIDYNNTRNPHWYPHQMRRALNQTIGRVIRSKSDYGMLLLCDYRYQNMKMSISEWARSYYPDEFTPIAQVELAVKNFFATHGIDIVQTSGITSSSDSGAFEFDSNSVRPHPKAILASDHTLLKKANQSNLVSTTFTNDPSTTITSSVALKRTSPCNSPVLSAADKLKALKDSYKVDKETYDKVQQNLGQKTKETQPVVKKAKSAFEALDLYCGMNNQSSLDTTQTSAALATEPCRENYPILNRPKNRPSKYICYICSNEAVKPQATNCLCAKVGCESCLQVLNKKLCGKCNTIIDKKKFKPRLFHSAFSRREKLNQS